MKRFKFISSLMTLIMVAVMLSGGIIVRAQSLTDLKKKQTDNNSRLNSAREALGKARAEKNDLLAEVIQLDIELEELYDEVEFISEILEKTLNQLEQAELDLAEAAILREEQRAMLIQRLRAMDESGGASYLQILLSSKSLADFIDRLDNIKAIAEYDRNLYTELEATENLISEKVDEISTKKLETEILLAHKLEIQSELEEIIEEKHSRMAALTADEQTHLKLIADLDKSNNELAKSIAEAQKALDAERARNAASKAAQQVYTGGKLGWPIPGYSNVSSDYGNRTKPRREFHYGIDWNAPRGTNIAAAEKGVVIEAGWRSGYGNCVTIDHGSGLSTLYAHASKLLVSKGAVVSRGQTIALVGSTGYSTGNHLHFEVRVSGVATNPWNYLR